MKLSTQTLLLSLPLALAFRPASEEINLTPRYAVDQTYSISQAFTMTMGLDDVSATMDGQEMLDGAVEFDMDMSMETEITEQVMEVRDGKIAKMLVTVDAMDVSVTGELNAMGQGESIDEAPDIPVVGRTVEMTIDKDGEITRKDVTKDVEAPLSEAEMNMVSNQNHFEMLAPEGPVEEGKAFELQPNWDEMMTQMMASMDSGGAEAEQVAMMETMMDSLMGAMTFEAVGKVTSVEEGIATVEYEANVAMNIDDLMEIVMQALPPEAAEQMPPVNAQLEVTADMTATAMFNIEMGQFVSIEMSGEFEINMSGDADLGGAAGDASASMSGEFSGKSSIE